MNAQQLRNSILQQAIQGKLVPQDPTDEPASVLLQRIRKEKERLVKEGKLKKKDLESRSIEEGEIPFEIPESWEWVRFGTITINRDCERVPLSVDERSKLKKKYDYYGASGVIDKVDRFLFNKPLLLIGEDGANLINRSTPIAFIAKGEYWVNNHAHVLDYCDEDLMQYVCWYINSISLVEYVTGTAQPKMNQESRIVAKIEELMPLVERYGKAQQALDQLNESLPAHLRQSILQEAIQGRLVPQDPKEEPASELLKRIRKDKVQLVKEGKIYKKKDTPPFFDADNYPFEIPSTWVWSQLSDISIIQEGAGIRKYQYTNNGIQLLCVTNILEGSVDLSKKTLCISENEYKEKYQHLTPQKGDIVTACSGGSWGKVAVFDCDNIVMLNTSTLRLRFFNDLADNKYLYYLAQSKFFKDQLSSQLVGIQPNFGYAHYSRICIPLPPLSEQRRIVAKVEELFGVMDSLPLCHKNQPLTH